LVQSVIDTAVKYGYQTVNSDGTHSGIASTNIATLLADFAVPSQESQGTVALVEQALSQHEGVIAIVDANELPAWGQQDTLVPDPNHAVVVTGIDASTNTVYLNDSALTNGAGETLTIDQFLAAWNDGSYDMVVSN
jgi:hypothetical protein